MERTWERIIYIAIISCLLGLFIIFISYFLVPTEHHVWVSTIGGILLGIGLVELVFKLFVEKDLVKKISHQICYDMRQPLEEFYQDRNELPSFKDTLKDCSQVWVAWPTGGVAGQQGFIKELSSLF